MPCTLSLPRYLRTAAVALLAVIAGVLPAAFARAQGTAGNPPELRLSTAQGPAFALGKAGERWAQAINDKAGGAFEVKQYPGAVLAGRDPGREFGALKDGPADLAVGSALAWSAQLPAFGVYALPWLAAEAREQEALAADVSLRDLVAAQADRAGVVVLAVAPLGDRVLATTKSAVLAPAEMAGLRVRVLPNPLVIETFSALGARATAMGLADAQAALIAGALEGQEAPPSTLAAARFAAFGQKFVTRWGAFADVMVFAVRRGTWDAWNEAQRALVRGAAIDVARESAVLQREEAALAELTKQGVTIVRLGAAQRAAFRAAAQPVWSKWTAPIGPDLVRAAEAAVALPATK
ncbi:MAG: TRAP transporter substrate-binding protein DctP [Casimicrobiaceae bacterium]